MRLKVKYAEYLCESTIIFSITDWSKYAKSISWLVLFNLLCSPTSDASNFAETQSSMLKAFHFFERLLNRPRWNGDSVRLVT